MSNRTCTAVISFSSDMACSTSEALVFLCYKENYCVYFIEKKIWLLYVFQIYHVQQSHPRISSDSETWVKKMT